MTTKTESLKSSLIGGAHLLAALLVFAIGYAVVTANAADPASAERNEAPGAPTFADYRAEAEKVCGGPVVKTSPAVKSSTVIVVKNDGSVVEMTTDDARDLMRADVPVWPIAVCA